MDGLASRASMIRLSLQPSPASETSAFNNIRAFSSRRAGNQRLKLLALCAAQPHNIPLYRNLLRKHPCLHRQIVAMAANHQILSNWLKRATRIRRISINPARFTSCDHAPGGCFPGLRSLTLPAPGSSVLSATPCPEGHSMASFTTTPLTDHTGVELIGAKRP